jgi:hypothetical protein
MFIALQMHITVTMTKGPSFYLGFCESLIIWGPLVGPDFASLLMGSIN